jgi:hypothetical protein
MIHLYGKEHIEGRLPRAFIHIAGNPERWCAVTIFQDVETTLLRCEVECGIAVAEIAAHTRFDEDLSLSILGDLTRAKRRRSSSSITAVF